MKTYQEKMSTFRNIFDSQSNFFKKKKELISEWNNFLNQIKQTYWNAMETEREYHSSYEI